MSYRIGFQCTCSWKKIKGHRKKVPQKSKSSFFLLSFKTTATSLKNNFETSSCISPYLSVWVRKLCGKAILAKIVHFIAWKTPFRPNKRPSKTSQDLLSWVLVILLVILVGARWWKLILISNLRKILPNREIIKFWLTLEH